MRVLIKVFFIFYLVFSANSVAAQGFNASLLIGGNAAQIDGDLLVGYHKLGLHGGMRVSYPFREKTDLGLELVYSSRGSRSPLSTGSQFVQFTNLKYLSVPVFINYKDWYIEEEKYYKVRAEGGLSYGYLFDVESTDMILVDGIGDFKRNDLSIHLGVAYSFNKKWTLGTKWTRSLLYIWKSPTLVNVEGLIGHFLTFRLEYTLL